MKKTTIEIADALFSEARTVAERDGTTLRSLFEEGLRLAVDRRRRKGAFRLRRVTFRGKGLAPGFAEAGWERIREVSYGGRGG